MIVLKKKNFAHLFDFYFFFILKKFFLEILWICEVDNTNILKIRN